MDDYKRAADEEAPSAKHKAEAKARLTEKFMNASANSLFHALKTFEGAIDDRLVDVSVNVDLEDGRTLGIYIINEKGDE